MQCEVSVLDGLRYGVRVGRTVLRLALDHVPHVLPRELRSLLPPVSVEDADVRLLPQLGYLSNGVVGRETHGEVVLHVATATGVRLRRDADGDRFFWHRAGAPVWWLLGNEKGWALVGKAWVSPLGWACDRSVDRGRRRDGRANLAFLVRNRRNRTTRCQGCEEEYSLVSSAAGRRREIAYKRGETSGVVHELSNSAIGRYKTRSFQVLGHLRS